MDQQARIALALALTEACAEEGMEQTRYLSVIQPSNQKALVVVTTTDAATEMLLEFLDSQRARGVTEPVEGSA